MAVKKGNKPTNAGGVEKHRFVWTRVLNRLVIYVAVGALILLFLNEKSLASAFPIEYEIHITAKNEVQTVGSLSRV